MEAKKFRIGSSDIAALIGENPYKTQVDVWMTKTGRAPKFEGNFDTERGELLEPVIAAYFTRHTGMEVRQETENHQTGSCIARTDYTYTMGEGKGILECKTTAQKVNAQNMPSMWYVQAQFQAAIMNRLGHNVNEVSIAWLSGSLAFDFEMFQADRELGEKLLTIAEDWVQKHLIQDIAPDPVNFNDIISLHPKSNGNAIEAEGELEIAVKNLTERHRQYKEAELLYQDAKQEVQAMMKDAEKVTLEGRTVVTWKNNKDSVRFDEKTFRQLHEKMYQRYLIEKPGARVFLIK